MEILFHGTGHYPIGAVIGPARWPHWDLLVVVRGLVILSAGRRSLNGQYRLEEGDAILIPPGVRFRGTGQTSHNAIWVLHLKNPMACSPGRTRHFRQVAGDAFARGLLTEIAGVYLGNPKVKSDPYLLSMVCTLWEKLHRHNRGGGRRQAGDARLRFWRIEDLETLSGSALPTSADLAAEAGLSVSHHRVLFTKEYGFPPGQHLRQLRIVYARKLLKETQLPIKRIASTVGYKDVVSFHRGFKNVCGCTPENSAKKIPLPFRAG